MRRSSVRPRKGWFGVDHELRAALGLELNIGMHMADAHLGAATDALKYRVIPSLEADAFEIVGDSQVAVAAATETLLDDGRDFWREPGLNMAFQSYVSELVYQRTTYSYIQFSETDPVALERIDWLAPETITKVKRGGTQCYEQYIRKELTDGRGPVCFTFDEDEVWELTWPFPWPSGAISPYRAALQVGLKEDRLMESVSLPVRAQTQPEESFVTFARARHNAYRDALAETRLIAAKAGDLLFYMAANEPITQYFEIKRLTRNEIAVCEMRDYLIREFNRQVLTQWASRNNWGNLALVSRAKLFSARDWADIWSGFEDRSLSYDDVVELIRANQDAARSIGRD